MSFAHTKPQFLDYSKDVTRRLGWWNLETGEHVMAIEKGMGLKRGEKQVELGVIEILEHYAERLHAVTQKEVEREGFPSMGPGEFVQFFIESNRSRVGGVRPSTLVNRIVFRRLD